jgi:hypothetical protein
MLIASGPHCRATCSAPHIQQHYFCFIECRSVSTTSTFKNAEEIHSLCRSHPMVYARSCVEQLIHIQLIIKFPITKHVGLPRLFVAWFLNYWSVFHNISFRIWLLPPAWFIFRILNSQLNAVCLMEAGETECISNLFHVSSISYCLQRVQCFISRYLVFIRV